MLVMMIESGETLPEVTVVLEMSPTVVVLLVI